MLPNSTHKRYFVDFVFSTSGGMLMDPFRPGGMGTTGGQGFGPPPHPGQLPRFVSEDAACTLILAVNSFPHK